MGYPTELQYSNPFGPSIRLRVENGKSIGEIVVWDTMHYDMLVADFRSGDYVLVKSGIELSAGVFEEYPASYLRFFPNGM